MCYFVGMETEYLCDTEVNLCYSSPCGGNGTCLQHEGGYTCDCHRGYAGKGGSTWMNAFNIYYTLFYITDETLCDCVCYTKCVMICYSHHKIFLWNIELLVQ